jgi:hypothetical protein
MPSKFGWVDFAEEDRRKMLDAIHLFRERDTRDELGIGTIRDSFSDYFFPGTSTVQTKARYMLFIPWIYLDLERKRISSSEIAEKARSREIRLIFSLLEGGEKEGVIGSDAKKRLKRLPSNIYWTGLGSWGIRMFNGSQDEYHRYLDKYYIRHLRGYGREIDDEYRASSKMPNWHPGLPEPPENIMKIAFLSLTFEEALYLRDRIFTRHPNSLLAAFIRKRSLYRVRFPWEHTAIESLSANLQYDLCHARNFSEVIHGASLLYNLMLSEAIKKEEWIEDYKGRLDDWTMILNTRFRELRDWYMNIIKFWKFKALKDANIPPQTKRFVNRWLEFVFIYPGLKNLTENDSVRSFIISREVLLKGNRARLRNKRALELWEGESGTAQLSYRWATASSFISDIIKGTKEKKRVA